MSHATAAVERAAAPASARGRPHAPPGDEAGGFASVLELLSLQGAQPPPAEAQTSARPASAEGAEPRSDSSGADGTAVTAENDVPAGATPAAGPEVEAEAPVRAVAVEPLPAAATLTAGAPPAAEPDAPPALLPAPAVPTAEGTASTTIAPAPSLSQAGADEPAPAVPTPEAGGDVPATPGTHAEPVPPPVSPAEDLDAAPAQAVSPAGPETPAEEAGAPAAPGAEVQPSRPGRVPEHGRGGEERREDPPAVGWRRQNGLEAPATPPAAPPAAQPAVDGSVPDAAAAPVRGERGSQAQAADAPAPAAAPERVVSVPLRAAEVATPEEPRPTGPALRAHARLGELADTAGALIRLAVRGDATVARIHVRPPELGHVEIRLRYQAGGVSAELRAEAPQAVQALASAAAELRRTLESQGIVLLGLDVLGPGDGAAHGSGRRGQADDSAHAGAHGAPADPFAEEAETRVSSPLLTSATSQVDVLA